MCCATRSRVSVRAHRQRLLSQEEEPDRGPACFVACQCLAAKIFYFTEIRKWRMCCPSRLILEGRSYVVTNCEPGLRWTRRRQAREVRAGRVVPVSPKPRADERRCEVRLANMLSARVHTADCHCGIGRCAYGKTVWSRPSSLRSSLAEVQGAQPGELHQPICEAREARRNSAPGRARHKPSNHRAGKAECLATPVCCCAVFLRYIFAQRTAGARSAPGLPCALLAKRAE